MSAMIGKSVTVDKSKFTHQKGNYSPVNYMLPQDAARVKITVVDEHGEDIYSKELEPQKSGSNTFNWDGMANNGIPQKSGSYSVKVEAEDQKGVKLKIDPISHEAIIGIAFDGGESNFLVGDPKQPQKIAMKNVVKIEGDTMARAAAAKNAPITEGQAGQADQFQLPLEKR